MSANSLSREQAWISFCESIPLHPLLALRVFFAFTFVAYILVSLVRSTAPLLFLDVLLAIALLETLALRRKGGVRILGGSPLVLAFLALYIYSILVGLTGDGGSLLSKIQGMRSLLFGLGFLILSSVWMNTARRVDGFLKIYLLGALFAALYGFRQLVFGLAPFELGHMASLGSSMREVATLGRIRIPSSFGDPATFAFVMMNAIAMLPVTRLRPFLPKLIQRHYRWTFGLLLAGLLMSLVRGPLVALAAAAAFLFLTGPRSVSTKIRYGLAILGIGVVFAFALNFVVMSGILTQSDNNLVRSVDNAMTSVWTAIPLPVNLESLTWQQRNLRTLSVSHRQTSWQDGLAFMSDNPFGAGISATTEGSRQIGLSIVDVGFLAYGVQLGWLGLLAFLGLFCSIPWVAYRKLQKISDQNIVKLGRYLLALWVAYFIALLGTPYLHTEMLSAGVWTVAGILLNLDVIARSCATE